MPDFDWVTARAECTAENVHHQLDEAVKADLRAHRARNPQLAQSLEYGRCHDGKFFIKRHQVHMVTFALTVDNKIKIERTSYVGDTEVLMTISVSLDKDGECTLIDKDSVAWRPWQVRRIALEQTFFGSS